MEWPEGTVASLVPGWWGHRISWEHVRITESHRRRKNVPPPECDED